MKEQYSQSENEIKKSLGAGINVEKKFFSSLADVIMPFVVRRMKRSLALVLR